MSTNLPIKSSSRAGRFKKKLVSEEALEKEAPIIAELMLPISDRLRREDVSAAEFTAIYIITILSQRFPGNWLGSKRHEPIVPSHQLQTPISSISMLWEPNIKKRLSNFSTIGEIFNYFALKSTPQTVNRAMLCWSLGSYGLELMFRIPNPQEVLHQQKQGRRCVTVILDKAKASKFILGERDSLSFTMHDLIHADHFYQNTQCFEGQLGFYGLLDYCLERKHFDGYLKDSEFEREFEYLISDMNAYAIHLLKCFKSAILHYNPNGVEFFAKWVQSLELNQNETYSLMSLNTKDYEGQQDEVLLGLLSRYQFNRNRALP
jgi:hypothetical protein